MQALARDGLTAAQVEAILRSTYLHVSYGCELLTPTLQVVEDMSADFGGGTVTRTMDATIHGTAQVKMSRELVWGVDLIRPYMTVTDEQANTAARFNVGVFCLVTPDEDRGETPGTYNVQGYDRLYLLNRPIGDTYTVAAGVGYLAAVAAVIAAAGLTGVLLDTTAAAKTLPAPMTWPLIRDPNSTSSTDNSNATWLRVVNDLLAAVNYRGMWCDENGFYRSAPYVNPRDRAPEFTFDSGTRTVLGSKFTITKDVWSAPNRWVFIQQNRDASLPAPVEGAGRYTVNNVAEGPTSQLARGLVWTSVVPLDAADQVTLVAQGDQRVAADMAVSETRKVTTSPFPAAGHADVAIHDDPELGAVKVQALDWQLDLGGADVSWTWSVVA